MRVDGKETEPLAMDNMQNRPIKNTNNWQSYSVVLDIKRRSAWYCIWCFIIRRRLCVAR